MAKQHNGITLESVTIKQLFQKKLSIPEYQRPYVWDKSDVEKMLRQFNIHGQRTDEKPLFYMGSIVLHENGDTFDIIDGQQRITTLLILNYLKTQQETKIQYANQISQTRIKEIYNYLLNKTLKEIELDIDQINVTLIITPSQDEAYSFFDTLNTGGKRLTGIDIIKAHHLRAIKINVGDFAKKWEKEQHYIENVVKLLIRARKMSVLSSEYDIPRRKDGNEFWKKIVTSEFSEKTLKNDTDIKYCMSIMNSDTLSMPGVSYFIRQQVSDGINFINYLLCYVDLYKNIFFEFGGFDACKYEKFIKEIIEPVDGTIDLKMLYEVSLVCYVSRFGTKKLTEASFWVFRFLYSLRVSVEYRIMEKTVINYNNQYHLIDRILYTNSEDEMIQWLKSHTYTISDSTSKVKERFIEKVSTFFGFSDITNNSDFDRLLTETLNK